jgi:hypothetical protein
MAARTPLTRPTLGAASVADDLGYVALSDLARAIGNVTDDYRVIGGHMVSVLAARWQLGHELYRETGDVDLGIPPIVIRDHLEGHDDSRDRAALIDVLVPAYTSHARGNVQIGDDLFTTEVPGLQLALARPPVTISPGLRRLNGEMLQCQLPFADEVSALVLKSLATKVRSKDTDVADIWRCLEIAFAAGIGPKDFASGVRAESADVIRSLFGDRRSAPVAALTSGQGLSAEAADTRFTEYAP